MKKFWQHIQAEAFFKMRVFLVDLKPCALKELQLIVISQETVNLRSPVISPETVESELRHIVTLTSASPHGLYISVEKLKE